MNPHVEPETTSSPLQPKSRRLAVVIGVAALMAVGLGTWIYGFDGRPIFGKSSRQQAEAAQAKNAAKTAVEVVHPQKGGIDRDCVQPGTVEPFESADLYAKVSGFLIDRAEIGTKVAKGDVLARIDVPEYKEQVKKDEASVNRADARIKQMEAYLKVAKAEEDAAKQLIAQAKIEFKSKGVYRDYRSKQLDRITALYKDNAVDARYLDEVTDHYEASFQAENAAREGVTTAELKWKASQQKVIQVAADVTAAEAEKEVAKAELGKSKVLLGYTIIQSPYDGVVTKRNFDRGDFIRSADAGGERMPIVAVDRTDLMRIVVQVPDPDVPYVDVGDPAEIEIDAVKGKLDKPIKIKGTVARKANAEDSQTRSMRTEIDVPNTNGELLRNMYGRVKILLQAKSPNALHIPAAALVSRDGQQAMVRVVRDHIAHVVTVETGIDNGVEVEILKGLTEADLVILKVNGPVDEGTTVNEIEVQTAANGH